MTNPSNIAPEKNDATTSEKAQNQDQNNISSRGNKQEGPANDTSNKNHKHKLLISKKCSLAYSKHYQLSFIAWVWRQIPRLNNLFRGKKET